MEELGLRKKSRRVLVPQKVWENFDIDVEVTDIKEVYVEEKDGIHHSLYRFNALIKDFEIADVSFYTYEPLEKTILDSILIVPEYHRFPTKELLDAFIRDGYRVFIVDITASSPYPTVYPQSLHYCVYDEDNDSLYKLEKTAKETCQHIYSCVVKRAVKFIEQQFEIRDVILLGMGTASDVAIQVVGSINKNIKALVCLNGCGYGEMQDTTRFLGEEPYNEEKIAWLSGVSAVAYAKYIDVPVFIALGSNSSKGNVDKLENIRSLLVEATLNYAYCPGFSDFITPRLHTSVITWLNSLRTGAYIPENPEIAIRINKENKLYFDITCDPGLIVDQVNVFYSFDEENNQVRDWRMGKVDTVSHNEYMCAPKLIAEETKEIYAFALVTYITGLTLNSKLLKKDISENNKLKNNRDQEGDNTVIYQPAEGTSPFVENYSGDILLERTLKIAKSSKGLKGITAGEIPLKTYKLKKNVLNRESIIQINICSPQDVDAKVTLLCTTKQNTIEEYYTVKQIPDTSGFFYNYMFNLKEFKNKDRMSIKNTSEIKAIVIDAPNVLVGNMIIL